MARKYAKINHNSEINATVFIEYPSNKNPKGKLGLCIGRIIDENGRLLDMASLERLNRIVSFEKPNFPAGLDSFTERHKWSKDNIWAGRAFTAPVSNLFSTDIKKLVNNADEIYEITNLDEEKMIMRQHEEKMKEGNIMEFNSDYIVHRVLYAGGIWSLLSSFDTFIIGRHNNPVKFIGKLCKILCDKKYARARGSKECTRNNGRIMSFLHNAFK
ncbi:hypothetical protein Xmau_00864 [Xenorhabdus mauleonii]|uniref:Uncharacterized protein n=1 Tax=Xenorhabdus mauleonii TaxID=351675 RepID=A0A1I3RQL6_9GAMM|nr:hypothetical protein [Xenorhabdus mauleonii]PHM46450.1 hypothetical protein Xmau_00864 [Xenorhabdus mauleonii]SFJ48864.1 hypothetical protein SAMN05421680_11028 [Xenorhabdus mauleonii]